MAGEYIRGLLASLAAGICIAVGTYNLAEGISKRNEVRNTIYSRAEQVTPEVIKRADNSANSVGRGDLAISALYFGFAGAMGFSGAVALKESRKTQ